VATKLSSWPLKFGSEMIDSGRLAGDPAFFEAVSCFWLAH
jgi:hypothetical protein